MNTARSARTLVAAAALAPALAVGAAALTATGPADAATYSGTLRAAAKALPVAAEVRSGYDRAAFRHWTDADRDGCSTRNEVLIAEAVTKPKVGARCSLTGGKWVSYYDGKTTTNPSTFDIDHMVPLAEAWDSGAWSWTAKTRENFANDMSDPRALVAVTAKSNRTKSDQDPGTWLPSKESCRYVREFVAVKTRWSLTVDATEKKRLVAKANACPNVKLSVVKASVTKANTPPPSTPPQNPSSTGGLKVTKIVYDPSGADDALNANSEVVTLINTTSNPVQVSGWKLADAAGNTFSFPAFSVPAGGTVYVHSGNGTNGTVSGAEHLYAGWGHTWNNSGDTFTLRNATGTALQSASYPGGGAGYATF